MKYKILYIAGLGHSGSTILDLSLGCNTFLVGLGEVLNVLAPDNEYLLEDNFNKIICSCGQNMYNCEFWSGAKKELLKNDQKDIKNKYQIIVNYFNEVYNYETILVDSSKSLEGFFNYLKTPFNIKGLFLIRDLRSWIYSRHSRYGINMLKLALKWYRNNLKIKRGLKTSKAPFMNIGYEELSLYPEYILKKICSFVDIEYDPLMLKPSYSKSHIIRGNVARGDEIKKRQFMYDARWLTSLKLSLLTPLLLPLLSWNNDNVYSNFTKGKTNAFGVQQKDFIVFGDKRKMDLLDHLNENEN